MLLDGGVVFNRGTKNLIRKLAAVFLWAVLISNALEVSSTGRSTTNRAKRVLNGEEITVRNQANYKVTRYYATYATLHGFPFWAFWPGSYGWRKYYKRGVEGGYYGEVFCGGALLTPEIVQTACHCVSDWKAHSSLVSRPVVNHEWEQVKVLYTGVNNRFYPDPAMISQKPIKTLKFIVHEKCGRLKGADYEPNSYDYAWITIDPSWTYPDSGVPTYRLAFAPIYDSTALIELDKKIRSYQAVCLHIGFGRYSKNSPVTSPVLLHGWSQVISSDSCAMSTAGGVPDDLLEDLMNWFCAKTFNKHLQPTQRGDSGSPVTCNDEYMGVVSGHLGKSYRDSDNRPYEVYWSIHGSTANTAYSMTSQSREAFSKGIRNAAVKTFAAINDEMHFTSAERMPDLEVAPRGFAESSYTSISIPVLVFSALYHLSN